MEVEIPENIPGKPITGADIIGNDQLMTQPRHGYFPLGIYLGELIPGVDMRGQEY